MELKDIPDIKEKYPKRVTFACSEDAHYKLQFLKKTKKKDPSALIRKLVDEFFEENESYFKESSDIGE